MVVTFKLNLTANSDCIFVISIKNTKTKKYIKCLLSGTIPYDYTFSFLLIAQHYAVYLLSRQYY